MTSSGISLLVISSISSRVTDFTFGVSEARYELGAHTVNGSTFTSGSTHTVGGAVAVALAEDGTETSQLNGITQAREHVGIVVERRRQLHEHLVLLGRETPLLHAVLVDVFHAVLVDIKPRAKPFRAQHVVEIGDGREILCREPAVERIESHYPLVFILHVCVHESYTWCHELKKRTGERLAEDGDPQVGILRGELVDYGHHHSYVAHGRETNDEDVVCLH